MKTWLLGFVLALAAVAVVLARESPGKPRGADPTPASTPTASPVSRAFQPVVVPTPTAPATPRPASVVTARPTTVPTRVATPVPTARATMAPTVMPTHAATPTPVPAAGARVALTFDAGADRGYAEDILDLLRSEHVVASFGITGQWAKSNGDLVRRMAADGHLVFNHTLDHRSFTGVSDSRGGLPPAARRAELTDADAIIAPLIGHSTLPYYRLPYGDDDARVATDVAPAGYSRKVGWTVDSMGWRGIPASDIVTRCLSLAAPGAVYVFHVGRASQDSIALSRIVSGLKQHGFGFRRVDDS